jgi:predicted lipoprotein with Yx(FWY)xxD motif
MRSAIFPVAIALTTLTAMAKPTMDVGGLLTDTNGHTLYTFAYDQPGKSNCGSACTALWYPYRASAAQVGEGRFTIVERADGIRQWAMDGRPLYLYRGDVRPRDVNGDMLGWPWHVVRFDGRIDQPPELAR